MTITQTRALVGNQIGLPSSFDGTVAAYRDLSPTQQADLTREVINFIRNNPGKFTTEQVATANAQFGQAQTLSPTDASFSFSQFFDELETEAYNVVGAPLQAVGQGVSTTVKLVGTLIPILVVVVAVVYFLPQIKSASK